MNRLAKAPWRQAPALLLLGLTLFELACSNALRAESAVALHLLLTVAILTGAPMWPLGWTPPHGPPFLTVPDLSAPLFRRATALPGWFLGACRKCVAALGWRQFRALLLGAGLGLQFRLWPQ